MKITRLIKANRLSSRKNLMNIFSIGMLHNSDNRYSLISFPLASRAISAKIFLLHTMETVEYARIMRFPKNLKSLEARLETTLELLK